jgi:hypothetical protein
MPDGGVAVSPLMKSIDSTSGARAAFRTGVSVSCGSLPLSGH